MGHGTDSKPVAEEPQDVVLLHGRTEDGAGFQALRAREGRLEHAEVRPVKEGQPLGGGELVALRPRPAFPLICDVEVLFRPGEVEEPAPASTGHAGPARVTTRAYRENWEQIFRARVGEGGEPN